VKPVYIRPTCYPRWCILRHYVHGGATSTLCFARVADDVELSAGPPITDRCTACSSELEALRRGGPTAPMSPEEWERDAQGASREWVEPEEVSTRR
jgi:hypothetical protein